MAEIKAKLDTRTRWMPSFHGIIRSSLRDVITGQKAISYIIGMILPKSIHFGGKKWKKEEKIHGIGEALCVIPIEQKLLGLLRCKLYKNNFLWTSEPILNFWTISTSATIS